MSDSFVTASRMDLIVDDFNVMFKGEMTIDELCLRPRQALEFCDSVRSKHGMYDVPDDIILRSVMTRRKNPGG